LVDPPKETVPAAIATCRAAGVRVIMVTGDHPLTAAAIARQVGIITTFTREEIAAARNIDPSLVDEEEVDAVVVRGVDLESFTQKDWDRVLSKSEVVFARTTPNQKLEIVQNLQRLKHIVAVTGDGVNDAPAEKAADIGIAMGISGSDVARDAADVILMDDDFGSIVVGIREGRTIFDNLIKTITYTITHMVPEVTPVLLNLAFGFPLGLNAILILAIDIGTEMAPAISLAYEKAESDVMSRPPRNARTDHLVTGRTLFYWYLMAGAWETLTCLLNYFLIFNHFGIRPGDFPFTDNYFIDDDDQYFCPGGWKGPICTRGPTSDQCSADSFPGGQFNTELGYPPECQNQILAYVQTGYWVALVGTQFFHIWMCKTRFLSVFTHGLFHNMMMNFGVIIELAIIIIVVFAPVHSFFHNGEFPGIYWLVVLVGWAGIFLLNEPRKWAIRNYPNNAFVKLVSW
jgi:sodium/potassium-transporting ATPase subunit alpha